MLLLLLPILSSGNLLRKTRERWPQFLDHAFVLADSAHAPAVALTEADFARCARWIASESGLNACWHWTAFIKVCACAEMQLSAASCVCVKKRKLVLCFAFHFFSLAYIGKPHNQRLQGDQLAREWHVQGAGITDALVRQLEWRMCHEWRAAVRPSLADAPLAVAVAAQAEEAEAAALVERRAAQLRLQCVRHVTKGMKRK